MKPLIPALLIVFISIAATLAGDNKSDLDLMQGTWIVASLTERGKALLPDDIEVVFEKDIVTAFEKGKLVLKAQIKLDSTKKPKAIDFTYLIGDAKGKTEPGIYRLAKDQLTLVLDEDRKGRPTAFDGKGTESYSIHVLKKKPK